MEESIDSHSFLGSDIKLLRSELPPLMRYMEGKTFVVYSRALELHGYGITREEAEQSFMVNLEEFIKLHRSNGTFEEELKKLGWEMEQDHWKFYNKRG